MAQSLRGPARPRGLCGVHLSNATALAGCQHRVDTRRSPLGADVWAQRPRTILHLITLADARAPPPGELRPALPVRLRPWFTEAAMRTFLTVPFGRGLGLDSRRRQCRRARAAAAAVRQVCEALEQRCLLSTIDWTNR